MDPLYVFALYAPVNGITHVGVLEEIRDGRRISVSGSYGTLDDDDFQPSAIAVPYNVKISGEDLIDLDAQSLAAGRPPAKPCWEIGSADVAAWLAEDPAVREARIEERRPDPEPGA
jgi:hypothetical protein